ncbi:MAG TPA: PPOX class F420-dependent oxidoreductase [Acidimicrobiales bacterium]|nr:PPOX class F420-dependent oxidoreductase [Acidimicrobiales bacterium]
MARDMTPDEVRRFLLHGTRTGKVATVRADGRPHVAPIWFTLDGDDVLFTTWHESVKGRTLQRDPRVAISVDDETPPFSFVAIEGEATLSRDLDELRRWATVIGGRYMGEAQAAAFGERNGVEGELLVRVRPTRIIGKAGVSE